MKRLSPETHLYISATIVVALSWLTFVVWLSQR